MNDSVAALCWAWLMVLCPLALIVLGTFFVLACRWHSRRRQRLMAAWAAEIRQHNLDVLPSRIAIPRSNLFVFLCELRRRGRLSQLGQRILRTASAASFGIGDGELQAITNPYMSIPVTFCITRRTLVELIVLTYTDSALAGRTVYLNAQFAPIYSRWLDEFEEGL